MNFSKHWAAVLDDYAIDLAWSPAGTLLAAASAGGSVTVHNAATGSVHHALPGHEDGTNCLAWRPAQMWEVGGQKSEILASGGQDGCVRYWDAITGKQTAEVNLGNAWVEHLAWVLVPSAQPSTLNSQLLFAAAGRKLVALKSDGTVAHTFPDAPKTISALAARPALNSQPSTLNSAALAAACFGHVAIWDATTFAAQKEFPYGNAIYALTWSPDNRWLVAGCHDNAVHLWVPAEDLELHMSGYETRLKELSFSHDSKWLATGGGRDACVWDCSGAGPEGREPMLLPHHARVVAVAFQNQHGLLATGSAEGVFTLWAPSRKNPMIAEVRMPAAATKFAWRADDELLAVGTEKGQVFVF
ncbi:MAG TPA: WD40 repeat domain-containing protein, partial [Candidatus Didemnitutus sp.]|nr:WD40 repeat domain-containing protein [Candidatus Didemnitutus sp.]